MGGESSRQSSLDATGMLYDARDTATLNDAAHMYFAYHGNGVRFCMATLIYWDFVFHVLQHGRKHRRSYELVASTYLKL